MSAATYPVRVDAVLDRRLSRWLWLVKWLLVIPHYIILGFLWIAFAVLSAAAFFAILFTGRYPESIFEFNVGVLRWTWRVQYYAYGALGTDHYPPFSLQDVPDYPAHLAIEYPQRLSRGLVLVKWWLLAIPQYIIVGLFIGGGTLVAYQAGHRSLNLAASGLIGILVLIAAVILAFTGRYPDSIFDLVLGMNRWVLRVAAYASLMTDKYPPFRLDLGGHEPGSTLTLSGPEVEAAASQPPAWMAAEPPAGPAGPAGWTTGRVIAVVVGSVLALAACCWFAAGAALLGVGQASNSGGYVTTASTDFQTSGRALATQTIQLPADGWYGALRPMLGKVRVRVTSSDPARPVFVGIASSAAVSDYLSGVQRTTITSLDGNATIEHPGDIVPPRPVTARIWTVHAVGTGTQSLVWTAPSGNWVIVAMNQDASARLSVHADIGATLPALPWIAGGLLVSGLIFGTGSILVLVTTVRRAER